MFLLQPANAYDGRRWLLDGKHFTGFADSYPQPDA
jgi:hypothetical protein